MINNILNNKNNKCKGKKIQKYYFKFHIVKIEEIE